MRKKFLPLVAIAIMMFFVSCSNEELFPEINNEAQLGNGREMSITALMPEKPTSRVGLEQKADETIELTWKDGDELQLAYVKEGATTIKQTVQVTRITENGKKAHFNIALPAEFETGNFDLYGVYGAGELSVTGDNATVKLPVSAGSATSLQDVENRKDVMLHFASKNINATNPNVSVLFKHLGSLFGITVKNTSGAIFTGLKEMRLIGGGVDANWAYNNGLGGKSYNLETGEFEEIESGGNYISFNTQGMNLADGEALTLWSWSPMPGKVWPELSLQAITPDDNVYKTSTNTKAAKPTAPIAGMVYYFNTEWNGTNIKFKSSREPHIFVKTTGVEENDGLSWATATTMSKALEMMEEGDNIHIAAGTYIPTNKITGGDKDRDFTFEINSNVTLIGGYPSNASDGAVPSKINETILSGNGEYYHTVTVTAPVEAGKKVVVKNLTLKDGLAGIYTKSPVIGDGEVIVEGVPFSREAGGGLSVGRAVVDLVDCVISNNQSQGFGAGVHTHSGAIVSFTNTEIISNETKTENTNGGGIWNAGATVFLEGCNISDNIAWGVGGGIYNFDESGDDKQHSNLYVYNCTFANNLANNKETYAGGAMYGREFSYTRIANSTFYGNESGQGGAIRFYGSASHPTVADIISSTFYKNHATRHSGGILTGTNTTVKISNTIISGNTAAYPANAQDITFHASTTKSYMTIGNQVLDVVGAILSAETFDPATMISDMGANGTCMITATSPAATLGMSSAELQTLASGLVPSIANDIITKDQLGVSRAGKKVMGAVVPSGGGSGSGSGSAPVMDPEFP